MEAKRLIVNGKTALGIELGSTRIKGVLIDFKGQVLAVGIYNWENSFVDDIWTYSLEEIHTGIRRCYNSLRENVEGKCGVSLQNIGSIGISAMMHGYMALDKDGKQIAPFQTWRNTNTQKAADELTEEGAVFLDETGTLRAGIPLCPPEGDAGTGMAATNSVAPGTGNVSAGTSTFAMIVLEKQLSRVYREIDMVTTPAGFPCAMSHANNGTSDLNAWIDLFKEFSDLMGIKAETGELFEKLYTNALNGDPDCGGLLAYGYYSGENITMLNEGRLAFLRTAESRFNLANFMKVHLFTSLGAVKMGMDILMEDEKVKVERIMGHGGFFKTKGVGQRYLAAAVNAPVTVMDTASEGGAWGIALLAVYMIDKEIGEKLEDYLENRIFGELSGETVIPYAEEVEGFRIFMQRYKAGLAIEKSAIEVMDW